MLNLFLHYAFDRWMRRTVPPCPFARYADDGVVHWRTEQQAHEMKQLLAAQYAAILAGWWHYYGSFYPPAMRNVFPHFDRMLAWGARRKYKSLRRHKRRSRDWLAKVSGREQKLFVHWRLRYGMAR